MDPLAWIRTSSRRRRRGIDEKEKVNADGDGRSHGGAHGDGNGNGVMLIQTVNGFHRWAEVQMASCALFNFANQYDANQTMAIWWLDLWKICNIDWQIGEC